MTTYDLFDWPDVNDQVTHICSLAWVEKELLALRDRGSVIMHTCLECERDYKLAGIIYRNTFKCQWQYTGYGTADGRAPTRTVRNKPPANYPTTDGPTIFDTIGNFSDVQI